MPRRNFASTLADVVGLARAFTTLPDTRRVLISALGDAPTAICGFAISGADRIRVLAARRCAKKRALMALIPGSESALTSYVTIGSSSAVCGAGFGAATTVFEPFQQAWLHQRP